MKYHIKKIGGTWLLWYIPQSPNTYCATSWSTGETSFNDAIEKMDAHARFMVSGYGKV